MSSLTKFFTSSQREETPPSGHGARILFAIDATASRSHVWEKVSQIHHEMFSAAESLGEIEVQLVFFRGERECKATPWLKNSGTMGTFLNKIFCEAGLTQINRVLQHALDQHDRAPVHAMIYIGDSCEENFQEIETSAEILGIRKVPVFVFHDQHGGRTAQQNRNADTHLIFKRMAEVSKGGYVPLNTSSSKVLSQLLQAVVIYAAAGRQALEHYAKQKGVDGSVLRLTRQLG